MTGDPCQPIRDLTRIQRDIEELEASLEAGLHLGERGS